MGTHLAIGAALAALALGCGAPEAPSETTERADDETPEAETELTPPAETAEPEIEPEPEPQIVEAGSRLGPIRIGMSEEEVGGLGLPLTAPSVDQPEPIYGPYRVFFDDGRVVRIEAQLGALARIQLGEAVFDSTTHIHTLRDAFGDCVWFEGGGERYRCANGTLFVETTHSLDPARYRLSVVAAR